MVTVDCSFCKKSQADVAEAIVKGPYGAHICAECVDICAEIVGEFRSENLKKKCLKTPFELLEGVIAEVGIRRRSRLAP